MNQINNCSDWVKSRICNMWNQDYAVNQIATRFQLGMDDVINYLYTRPGFPGVVTLPKQTMRGKGWTWKKIMQEMQSDAQLDS